MICRKELSKEELIGSRILTRPSSDSVLGDLQGDVSPCSYFSNYIASTVSLQSGQGYDRSEEDGDDNEMEYRVVAAFMHCVHAFAQRLCQSERKASFCP